MIYKINSKGQLFYKKRRREVFQFLITFPVFITIVAFLFIIGSKNTVHLNFSVFLICLLILVLLLAMYSIMRKINKTICEIELKDKLIRVKSFSILFLKSREFWVEKDMIKFISENFRVSTKKEVKGWLIVYGKNELSIFSDFFNKDLWDNLSSSGLVK